MFVRTIARRQGAKTYEYLYLVEGHRVGGRVQQRVVSPIGRADLLAPHLDRLLTLLRPTHGSVSSARARSRQSMG